MSRAARTALFAATVLSNVRAQECDRPNLLDSIPADGDVDVPLNALLVARYDPRAEYLGESVFFGEVDEEPVALTAFFNENEGLLEITPPTPLESRRQYRVEWPKLRGVGTASLGSGAIVEFTAGAEDDTEAPRFEGVEDVSWSIERKRDDCIDRQDERFLFEIELGRVSDDGPQEALALIVFQSEGPALSDEGAATPVLVRAMPEDDRVRVRLPIASAEGEVCFAAIVRDSAGFVSASGSVESCVTTQAPPFFHGCSLPGRPRLTFSVAVITAVVAGGLLARRRAGKRRAST